MLRSTVLVSITLALTVALALPGVAAGASWSTAPCSDTWGTNRDMLAIEKTMASGSAADVTAAINAAKASRGKNVGCYNAGYSYARADFTTPSWAEVLGVWRRVHEPAIACDKGGCPTLARFHAANAIGAYHALDAGLPVDVAALEQTALLLMATQYSPATVSGKLLHPPGSFGYLNTSVFDSCFLNVPVQSGGTVGQIVAKSCMRDPSLCVVYDRGPFAGKSFQIADIGVPDLFPDGSMGFDHGWAGVLMIEAAIHARDAELRERFKEAALLAGTWAQFEPPVRNHNYTAKLVWLLARLYAWTGDTKWRDAMLDKVERNLKPGVLMDLDADGYVDGMPGIAFSSLSNVVAQRPGRMWDGHNARPVYHAMNAWALVEAYVALRDRNDQEAAAALKPYAIAMLDNIAWEINFLGVPKSGRTQVPYALLLGLWKIAQYESEPRPDWERAAWALWNSGTLFAYGDTADTANSYNVGLYLLYLSGVRYQP